MSTRTARRDDLLSFTDQALFLAVRATGQEPVMQCVWVYDRPIDYDGVRRFHQNFGYGLIGRLVEPSPLPFGRHRWVSALGPTRELDIDDPRPRSELSDWADERVYGPPIDPEYGPGWHIGVLPMTDGSTAVSIVVSHCLVDGIGGLFTILETLMGNTPDFGYQPPRSRRRRQALLSDARETVRGLPELARTVVAVAGLAFRRRDEIAKTPPRPAVEAGQQAAGTDACVVPAVTVHVDVAEWDARAAELGGNSYSLFAGFAAKLGERLGRVGTDGTVSLLIPQNDRTDGDTRANAALLATAKVDPKPVTADLSQARATIRQALKDVRETPDEKLVFLPLIPFIPMFAVKKVADVLLGFADLPVSASNVGDVPPVMNQLDGTDADYVFLRGMDRHVPRDILDRRGGQLTIVSGRIGGKMSIAVVAYEPGAENTKAWLRALAQETLAEFGLTGVLI